MFVKVETGPFGTRDLKLESWRKFYSFSTKEGLRKSKIECPFVMAYDRGSSLTKIGSVYSILPETTGTTESRCRVYRMVESLVNYHDEDRRDPNIRNISPP